MIRTVKQKDPRSKIRDYIRKAKFGEHRVFERSIDDELRTVATCDEERDAMLITDLLNEFHEGLIKKRA